MTKMDVATLLRLHQLAYELVIFHSRRAIENPRWLNATVEKQLKTAEGAADWLESQAGEIPPNLFPEKELRQPFLQLFSAFFNTSFHFDMRQSEGEIVSARIEPQFYRVSRHQQLRVVLLVLNEVTKAEGISLSETQLRQIAKQEALRTDVLILTYIWELGQRAIGKGKGIVAHRIWKVLPHHIRTKLDDRYVWLARQRVVDAMKAVSQDE